MSNSAASADPFSRRLRDHGSLATSLSIAMLLAACGGGGGTSSSGRTPSLNLSGTAATGAALAGANVQIKCAAGTGGVTTGADGSFSVVIAGAALPCVLEVSNGATTLHSAVESGAGESVKANITPLTELLIAKITGADPATLFAAFDAAAQAKLSAAAIDAARASLTSALQGAVDLSGVDPLKDRLVIGNPQDQLLDTLATVLATAQTTLQELTSAVAASGATNSLVTALLQPAAAHCAALHSGKYRVINPKMADIPGAPADPPHLLDIDATTLMVTNDLALPGELALAITPVDGAPCKFASVGDYGPETSLVAKSGVMVWRSPTSTGQIALALAIPEQVIPLAELAGSWNALEYFRDPINGINNFSPETYVLNFDAAGTITSATNTEAIGGTLSVNQSGGYDIGGSATELPSRVFAFTTADGHLSMFLLYSGGRGMSVLSKQSSLSLPGVGAVSNFWDFSIRTNGAASPLSDVTTTVKTVDSATQSYTRERASDGRIDGFTINQPRDGMRHRPAGSSPTSTGGTVNYSALLAMPLPGTGATVYSSVASTENFFGFAIDKP